MFEVKAKSIIVKGWKAKEWKVQGGRIQSQSICEKVGLKEVNNQKSMESVDTQVRESEGGKVGSEKV